MKVNLNL